MTEKEERKHSGFNVSTTLPAIVAAVILFVVSRHNYLLFHTVSETFSIIIACGIFMFAWNSRDMMENDYLLFLGVAYLFVAGIDLLHTLGYKGMGTFAGEGANLPTQLWILGRSFESVSLLVAPLFIGRRINFRLTFFIYLALLVFFLLTVFYWNIFPACYVEGAGLTPFKKTSEYVISFILLGALAFLYRKRSEFNRKVFYLLSASIVLTIFAELAFTLYVSVYGLSNLVGHYFKIISFYLIYRTIIETGLKEPFAILFRKLKQRETELQKAFSEIKTLQGIVPICSSCKKIRNDEGYWLQIEEYLRTHSDLDFTHGICLDCAEQLYPDIYPRVKGQDGRPGEEKIGS